MAWFNVVWAAMRFLVADGFVCDEIVDGIVDTENEVWEEDERANVMVAECSAAWHGLAFA